MTTTITIETKEPQLTLEDLPENGVYINSAGTLRTRPEAPFLHEKILPVQKILGHFEGETWVPWEGNVPQKKEFVGDLETGDLFVPEDSSEVWYCTGVAYKNIYDVKYVSCIDLKRYKKRGFEPVCQIKQYLGNLRDATVEVSDE